MLRPKPIPARPSLEWLRKTAKDRVAALRNTEPQTKLSQAQLEIAREFGFASWRAMKARIDRLAQRRTFAEDGAPPHLPRPSLIEGWPDFTPEAPLRILISGCLAGLPVLVDGGDLGGHPLMQRLLGLANVKAYPFCPENFSFGTPRETPDIHGGDGHDVLDGRARVYSETGKDWTDGMIAAAYRMLEIARANEVRLAVLTDISVCLWPGGDLPRRAGHGGSSDRPRPSAPRCWRGAVCRWSASARLQDAQRHLPQAEPAVP